MRNEEECVCSVCLFRCNILIGFRIIKETPGLVGSGTPYTNGTLTRYTDHRPILCDGFNRRGLNSFLLTVCHWGRFISQYFGFPRQLSFYQFIANLHHKKLQHHHISVMELCHLLTRSGLTYPEVSSKVCHDSFCQLGNSVSLPWVIYYGAFYLHVVSHT